ncbi:NifB/NifX family molybdenum-iron cluster-binding protein [Imhoffiella purpurea]|uniref:NifY protein n=1 Tax=Imhoffiella purpurea TaxID=1249627 RepID=W9VIA7_9GAMM|nr:NifB/NifX family molybdenum-iron cluster-binding protein [Imhoffiella purpurea]EXJ15792.1 NifY protein [Imhoffiella purpurea]
MAKLSHALALRIGLAARALQIPPARLVPLLIDVLKMPLTDQKLKALTLRQLRSARRGELGRVRRRVLEEALAFLGDRAGVDILDTAISTVEFYRDGDLPGSVRVAVASNEGLMLDGDFGTCLRYLVYQVSSEEIRLIEVRGTGGEKAAGNRPVWRAERIGDCQLLLARSVGNRAMAPLVHQGIYPVTYLKTMTAPVALYAVRQMLRDNPPPWLAKAMGGEMSQRMTESVQAAPSARRGSAVLSVS